MKKNVLIKGILVLVVLALLTVGFTGCGSIIPDPVPPPVPPPTGTVYITVAAWDENSYSYSIYMDGDYQGATYWSSNYTIFNVPVGSHTFSAYGSWGFHDSEYKYVSTGVNYVNLGLLY